MTREELAGAVELLLVAHGSARIVVDVLDLIRQREETILDQCRAALNAEREYQRTLHERVGSRYGAERHNRALELARSRREQAAKELGL